MNINLWVYVITMFVYLAMLVMVLIDEQTKSKGEPIDGSLTFLLVFTVVNLLMTFMQLARTLISCYMNLQFSKRLDGAN